MCGVCLERERAASTVQLTLSLSRAHTPHSGGSRISPRRGRQFPGDGGRQHMILPKFPENCMKLKEFEPGGGVQNFTMYIRHCRTSISMVHTYNQIFVLFSQDGHFVFKIQAALL